MRQRICVAVLLCACSAPIWAQGPGVPRLPTVGYDYVGYAITNLPGHLRAPQVQAADNTPANNPITNAGAELGRVLFYDQRLSHSNGTSCASCHQQEHGFSDPAQRSTGVDGELTARHSMGLSNANLYEPGSFFWDERAATLEDQVLQPIQSVVEMGLPLEQMVAKLQSTNYYPVLFERAFGTTEVTSERVSQALSQFVRSMVSYQSRFDQAFALGPPGNPNFAAVFTPDELAGQQIFHNQGRCADCHTGPAQVATETHNIGLDFVISLPGNPDGLDLGAGNGEFKVPSLRNIAVRGGFMHDGRFTTIEDVIRFYNAEVIDHQYLDPLMRNPNGSVRRLNLNTNQIRQLAAFLRTLTDQVFLTSDLFSNPFVQLGGDYNSDGIVDASDLDVWRDTFGTADPSVYLSADGNGDGFVDAADYTIWRDNMGLSWEDLNFAALNSPGVESVPEPSTMALAAAGGVMLLVMRRPTRRQGQPMRAKRSLGMPIAWYRAAGRPTCTMSNTTKH